MHVKAYVSENIVKAVALCNASQVCIEAKDNITLTVPILEMGLRVYLDGEIYSKGHAVCSIADFRKIENSLGQVEIVFDETNSQLIFQNKEATIKVYGNNDSLYWKEVKTTETTKISADTFSKILKKLEDFVSKDAYSYLQCVYFSSENREIVSSDGYRLGVYKPDFEIKSDAYVMRYAFKILKHLLPMVDEVELGSDGEYSKIAGYKNGVIKWEVYNSNPSSYPNYRAVIEGLEFKHVFSFNKKELVDALKKVKNIDIVVLEVSGNEAKLTFIDREGVEVRKQVEVVNMTLSEKIVIGFNPKFLLQGVEKFNSNIIIMDIIDANSIVQLKGDMDFTYYVMPRKIN